MKSMTGFGYSEYQDDKIHITLEVKSYNNRYLDIIVNLPVYLSPLEPRIRSFISKGVARGRVEVTVKVRELQEDIEVFLDEELVGSYIATLKRLAVTAEVDETLFLSKLLEMDGVLKIEKTRNMDDFWRLILPRLEEAFNEFEISRKTEGEHTQDDIRNYLKLLEKARQNIGKHAGGMETKIKENLISRFQELVREQFDENRILAETAMMLVKYGINEELVRIRGHLDTFRREIDAEGPCGKRLDFLCQELNREINTIGSKSVLIEVNQLVVEMKDSTENMREQLRNIE